MTETLGRSLPRRLLAVAAALATFYMVILTGQRALDAYNANQAVEATRHDIANLRARNIELQAELASSKLDEDIERTARQELDLAKPGDHPVILIWPEGTKPTADAPSLAAPAAEPNWQQWVHLFVDSPAPVR